MQMQSIEVMNPIFWLNLAAKKEKLEMLLACRLLGLRGTVHFGLVRNYKERYTENPQKNSQLHRTKLRLLMTSVEKHTVLEAEV